MKKLVIGIDQGYTRTGISLAADGELKTVRSLAFKGARSKSEKRKILKGTISHILKKNAYKASECIILVERIRQFSYGAKSGKNNKAFTNINYIKAVGALIGAIVDIAVEFDVEVYSVDTRSWKSKVVGTSKSKGEDKKHETVEFVKKLGFDVGKDDDAADSACIALYGFVADQKLKKEE